MLLLVVTAVVRSITASSEGSTEPTATVAEAPATSVPAVPPTDTEAPAPTEEPPGFGDGTYLVGTDVQPGRYRTDGTSTCYWERLSDLTGEFEAILANDNVSGQTYVEILPTDVAFSTDDCGRWEPAAFDGPDVSGGFGDGVYLVNADIQPGTYVSTGSSGCYWERLSDLTGEFEAILANDNPSGQTYVEILPTDVAFSTDDCGTWSRVG
ncbi:hypothetical protein ACI780_22740 [Geodermatophilus sp. SYSU D00814]